MSLATTEQLVSFATQCTDLATDHRNVRQGTLFFALRGDSTDGHLYVDAALAQGATAAVVSKDYLSKKEWSMNTKIIFVDDVAKALGCVASRHLNSPSKHMKIFGVTGTNGKTTSTYLLESLLKSANLKPAVIGTVMNRFNEHHIETAFTTPEALELQGLFSTFQKLGAQSIALEVSSHALAQDRTWGTQFEGVIFTNLTQDHLDYHLTMEDYFLTKTKLFFEYQSKYKAINIEDPYGLRLSKLCSEKNIAHTTFGFSNAQLNVQSLQWDATGIHGTLDAIPIQSPLLGKFNAMNIAGVVAMGMAMGLTSKEISTGIQNCKAVPGRLERIDDSRGRIVLVDYAHTPDALENVLKTLSSLKKQKLICIFGCGGDRDRTKRPLMARVASTLSDHVILTSDNPRTETPEAILDDIALGLTTNASSERITERKAAIQKGVSLLNPGDILLIAGKGHENYQIIGKTKHPFDDRLVAKEALQK